MTCVVPSADMLGISSIALPLSLCGSSLDTLCSRKSVGPCSNSSLCFGCEVQQKAANPQADTSRTQQLSGCHPSLYINKCSAQVSGTISEIIICFMLFIQSTHECLI